MLEVSERSTVTVGVSFTDHNKLSVTPTQAFYAVRNLSDGTWPVPETEMNPISAEVVLPVAATTLRDECRHKQRVVFLLRWLYDGGKQGTSEKAFVVRPLTADSQEGGV